MALSEYEIEMNYAQAVGQARELAGIAAGLTALAGTALASCLGKVRAGWTGEEAAAFIRKGFRMQEKLLLQARTLRGVALEAERAAARIRQADYHALHDLPPAV